MRSTTFAPAPTESAVAQRNLDAHAIDDFLRGRQLRPTDPPNSLSPLDQALAELGPSAQVHWLGRRAEPLASPFTTGHDDEAWSQQAVYLVAGLFLLSMLILVPLWNASLLLDDAAFFYFVGGAIPSVMAVICVSVLLSYIFVIRLFFCTTKVQSQTEQTLMSIGGSFASLLGVLFLLLSAPLQHVGKSSADEIWTNCQFGARARGLFMESRALQTLRNRPGCKDQDSVAMCPGYVQTPTALVLQKMEDDYICSGFCHKHALMAGAAVNSTGQVAIHSPRSHGLSEKPLTLFDPVLRHASCDGMAARSVQALAESVALQLFNEGSMLVLISMLMGYLRVFGLSSRPAKFGFGRGAEKGYGSIGEHPLAPA